MSVVKGEQQRELFRSILTVASTPAQVFSGEGLTVHAAEDDAARIALAALFAVSETYVLFLKLFIVMIV